MKIITELPASVAMTWDGEFPSICFAEDTENVPEFIIFFPGDFLGRADTPALGRKDIYQENYRLMSIID